MLTITKEFTFHAAHRLYLDHLSSEQNQAIYGKCAKLHGHTYRLQVTISGKLHANGMILNFSDLKQIVTDEVIQRYEHQYLNELEEFHGQPPTVEIMIQHIFAKLEPRLASMHIRLEAVTLYETPTSWATLRRDS